MASTKKTRSETTEFEPVLEKLESIAGRLENEDVSLAEALQSFEEGIVLVREAQQALAAAEQKVKLLLESNGEPVAGSAPDIEGQE